MTDLDGGGIAQGFMGQPADVGWHGSRKQQRLPLRRHLPDDAPDIGQEAHVEHVIGLVENQYLNLGKVGVALLEVVQQSPRAGHDDLGPTLQGLDLRVHADAAVDGGATQPGVAAQGAEGVVDLFREFTGGGHHEGAYPAPPPLEQTLEDGQCEGCSLAGSGLGQAHDVAPGEHQRYGLLLNRGGGLKTGMGHAGRHPWMEAKLVEIHNECRVLPWLT